MTQASTDRGMEGVSPSPADYGGLGERRELPEWGPGQTLAEIEFDAF